jgi:hypothetical protein
MKINKKISLQQFSPLSEAEIHGFLHPAEANLGYFLAWFLCLCLESRIYFEKRLFSFIHMIYSKGKFNFLCVYLSTMKIMSMLKHTLL